MPQAKQYTQTVFIGRFQVPHRAHAAIIEEALKNSRRLLLLIGSNNTSRTIRNPFTFQERVAMFQNMMPDAFETGRIIPVPIDDFTYQDQAWLQQVQDVVRKTGVPDDEIALIGCKKDNSSFYLNLFPNWDSIAMPFDDPVNATDLREALYKLAIMGDSEEAKADGGGGFGSRELDLTNKIMSWVPAEIFQDAMSYTNEPWFIDLAREWEWCDAYKFMARGTARFPIKIVTVDSVLIQSGHVAVIERGEKPGKGKIALIGGHLEDDETIDEGTLRELREEADPDLSDTQLRAARRVREVFDDPHRSARGRVITHATLFKLPDGPLVKLRAGDDAKKAFWLPLSEVDPSTMFEDHAFIIKALTARL